MVLCLIELVHAICVQYLLREGHMFKHFLRLQVSPLFRLHINPGKNGPLGAPM
jgi:hypothetical protein